MLAAGVSWPGDGVFFGHLTVPAAFVCKAWPTPFDVQTYSSCLYTVWHVHGKGWPSVLTAIAMMLQKL